MVKTKNGQKVIKGTPGIKPEVLDKDGNVVKIRTKGQIGE